MNGPEHDHMLVFQKLHLFKSEIGTAQGSPVFISNRGGPDEVDVAALLINPVGEQRLKVEAVYAAIAEEFHDFDPVTPYPSWIVDQLVVFSSDKLAEWCVFDRLQS